MTPEERLADVLRRRGEELGAHAERFEEAVADLEQRELLVGDSRASVERLLRVGTAELDAREADLARLADELAERERRVQAHEEELARRRGELGAVELKRAALEQREAALATREARLAALEEQREAGERAAVQAEQAASAPQPLVAFVPGERYRLVELTSPPLARGETVELEGEEYVVARSGPSPLPGDERPCVYLVHGRRLSPSGGSS